MSLEGLENLQALVDVIYNPFETLLVQQAKRLGVKAVGGFYMLVAQAVKAMELFKDVSLDEAVIDQVYQKLYQEKQNIVLTGMPGCGKSTIGKLLAQKLNRQFVDTDDYIEKQAGKSIKEIFQQQKESGFRELETQACQTLGKQQSLVLSTGGGAILKEENIEACRQNGKIFYIARAVEKLDVNDQRPLSQSLLDNQKLFEKRKELYQATADYIIDNDGDINRTLEQIWAIIHEDFSHERT